MTVPANTQCEYALLDSFGYRWRCTKLASHSVQWGGRRYWVCAHHNEPSRPHRQSFAPLSNWRATT